MSMRRFALPLAAAVAFAFAGCSKETAAPDSPLAYVPADTPFLFANTDGLPKPVLDAWADAFAGIGPFYEETLNDLADDLGKEEGNPLAGKVVRALAEELKGKYSIAGLESLGLTMQTRYALYGIGVVPVSRTELRDPAAFQAFIERIEGRVGEKLPRGQAGDQAFYRVGLPEGKLVGIAAIQGKHFVLTVAPQNASDALLRQLLGVDLPEKPYDVGQFTAFNDERDYLPYGSGYIDTVALAGALLDRRTAVEQEFLAALEIKDSTATPQCKTEFVAMAQHFPRFSFGYRTLEPKLMDIRGTLETDAELAADLKGLTAPVPGLGAPSDATMNFGWSMNLANIGAFINKHADAVAAAPYQCEALADLNTGWADIKEKAGNPMLFAMGGAIKGMNAAMSEFSMAPGTPPQVAGKVAIASDNPKALLQLAGNGLPALNSLNLTPGGEPVPLPAEFGMPGMTAPYAAMAEKALGASVGEGEQNDLVAFINQAPTPEQPLLAVGYSGKFFSNMAAMSQAALAMETDPEKREDAERGMKLMTELYGKALRHIDIVVFFTDKGAEFKETVTLN